MTCFWDAILQKLTRNDFNNFGLSHMDNSNFVRFLKNHAEKTPDVTWNDERLSDKQLQENYKHIIDFNPNSIRNGYDCSVCDPFLFLVCFLFNVDIDHNYNGHIMRYRVKNSNRCLRFSSNTGHFQCA
tara:strand:- start:1476 stop:1859 length:384 start_codon:yes stop_codon:yes gene_type:complete